MNPRILWNAKDFPGLHSGYGIMGEHLLPRFRDRYGAENVFIYAPVYQRDLIGEWQGMKVLPGVTFDFGENFILEHYKNFKCNVLIQVGDAWPLGELPDLASKDEILWIQWLPVDWVGMPKNIINRISPAYKLISFSKHGEAALKRAGLTNVGEAIWIGLDTNIWRPIPRENLPKLMQSLGFSYDSFNLLIVAANQERKRMRLQLEAVATFKRLEPEVDVRIYIHSQIKGDRDLRADLDELGLNDIVTFPDSYLMNVGGISEEQMCKIFNCADLVLNVCHEGFGLNQTQAQGCGVPVVGFSEGAGHELVQFGWESSPVSIETSAHQMSQAIPDPMSIAHCLVEAWKLRKERGLMRSESAVKFIQENFSWDKIAEQWFKVIDQTMVDREKFCYDIPRPSDELLKRSLEEIILK